MDDAARHRMTINHLECTYMVPRDHPAPERVGTELHDIARKYVTDFCGRALAEYVDSRDPSVWLIDKIQVDVLMDLSVAPPDEAGAFWAREMAAAVIRTIGRGEDGTHVMHFPSRVEYLAWFLRELAAGCAWGKWCYDQFASLRSLPTAAAIREALLREPRIAELVLLHLLRSNALTGVIECLSQLDQDRLLQLCAPDEEPASAPCYETAFAVWMAQSGSGSLLELYLSIRDAHPEYTAAQIRGALETLSIIERWCRESRLHPVLDALSTGRLPDILPGMSPQETGAALYLAVFTRENPAWLRKMVAAVEARSHQLALKLESRELHPGELHFSSSFGAVFLLLPGLLENRELMAAFGGPNQGHLRYLLFLTCLGARAKDASQDAALLLAAGFENAPPADTPEPTPARQRLLPSEQDLLHGDLESFDAVSLSLEPSLREELATAAAVMMRTFARRLPGIGKCSFDYLWRNVLAGGSTITKRSGRIAIEFEPRPLQIVLRMAGCCEMNFTAPWIPETEIVVQFVER